MGNRFDFKIYPTTRSTHLVGGCSFCIYNIVQKHRKDKDLMHLCCLTDGQMLKYALDNGIIDINALQSLQKDRNTETVNVRAKEDILQEITITSMTSQ